MDTRKINEKYAEIAKKIIDNEPELQHIKNSKATIIFLSSEHEKKSGGKIIHAQCEKIQDKYKWGIPCDFTITVFEPNVKLMNEKQIEILLFHELLHVGIEINNNGEEKYYCRPHDLEDFKLIIDRFGTEWSTVNNDEF